MATTAWNPVGSASDVVNVNPNTAGAITDIDKLLQGLQGAADPMAAFMGALPGLFSSAIGASSPFSQQAQLYSNLIAPTAMNMVGEKYNSEDAYYSSPSYTQQLRSVADIQAGTMRDVMGKQLDLGGQLAGFGASLLGQQTGLLGTLMGQKAALSAPEFWQPEYVQQNTPFGDFLGMLGPIAGIASMFIPGMQGVGASLLASTLPTFSSMTGRPPAGYGPMGGR